MQTFLFPGLSEDSRIHRIVPRIPMLNPDTRLAIYQLLAMLLTNVESVWRTLGLLEDLIPKGEYYLPPSLWDIFKLNGEQDVAYERSWEEDRSRILRTEPGYSGLRNLSNTCYINSLIAQLFMNVSFREFILQATITNIEEQRLLYETQRVFGMMQDSWLKWVDMQDLVESIVDYELQPIDVTIQMDVGEFYALLFHRLESQILSTEDQGKFRTIYGGQLVQQIKSKECTHVSEKVEPYTSIQCEIKGKSCLEDSLKAYVEGEVMQGGKT
jgi:ubiquitin carboxyl-terminal hydrolase 34